MAIYRKVILNQEALNIKFVKSLELFTNEELWEYQQVMERIAQGRENRREFVVNSKFGDKKVHKYNKIKIHLFDADDKFLHGHLNGRKNPKIDLRTGEIYTKNKDVEGSVFAHATPKQFEEIIDQIRKLKPEFLINGFTATP